MKLSFLDLLNLFGFSVGSMIITCAIFYSAYSNIHDKNNKNTHILYFAVNNVQTKLKQQQEVIDKLKIQITDIEKRMNHYIPSNDELPPPQP
jgi:CII-binding regulator of phage lambda lysogenization HflD